MFQPRGLHDTDPMLAYGGSPASRQQGPRQADPSDIWQILYADSWQQLKHVALVLLGPGSFDLGVCYGLVDGGWGVIANLLDTLKMLVLEGLYEEAHQSSRWTFLNLPQYLEAKAADYFLHSQLEAAHRQFATLIQQLDLLRAHPREFFGGIWNSEVADLSRKWSRYKWLMGHPSLANEFEAGRITGEVLLEAILLIAIALDGAGLVADAGRALSGVPELVRMARGVSSADAAKAVLEARRLETLRQAGGTLGDAEGGAGSAGGAASEARSWEYQPKQLGRLEPGAVPRTPQLERALDAAQARTAPVAPDGWPQMSNSTATTFGADPQAVSFAPGTKLYRVIGSDDSAGGSFWSTDPPPASEAEWRADYAVKDAWNGDGGYVEHTVGPEGLNAWAGPAAPQAAAQDGYVLPGGGQQVWAPGGTLTQDGPAVPTPWNSGGH